jgi:hypothetical protein
MGFSKHIRLTCHTCKRRHVSGGPKKGGSWDEARQVGWVLMVRSTLGEFIWLCPTCARKHASTNLPLGGPRKKK